MSFLVEKRVAGKGAVVLQDRLVISGIFSKEYLPNFAQPGGGDSISIRKYATEVADDYTGGDIVFDSLDEDFVTLVIDKHAHKPIKLTSKEIGLDITNFTKQVTEPMMNAIAQKIDTDAGKEVYKVKHSAKYTSSVVSAADIVMLDTQADELNFPDGLAKVLLVDPLTAGKILTADSNQLMDASFGADAGAALRTGILGEIAGVNVLKTKHLPKFVASTATGGTASALIPVNKSVTSISVDGLTSGETLAKGDILVFTNSDDSEVRLNVAAEYTATGSGDVVQVFYVEKEIENGAAFVVENVGFGCLCTTETFAIASFRQAPLPGLDNEFIDDEKSGVSIRISMGSQNYDTTIKADCQYGTQYVNRDLGIRANLATA